MVFRTQCRCLCSSETVSKVKLSSLLESPRQIAMVSSPETQLNEFLQENCKSGNWEEANGLLIEMLDQGPQPNLLTFNVMIDWLCKEGKINEANGLLELMIQRGLNPDTFTYNSLMDGYCLVGEN